MALGSLNLHVTKQDFLDRVDAVDQKMKRLKTIIERYEDAKRNLDQFVEEGDSTYEAWIERIDVNVNNCMRAYSSLVETKRSLQSTVDQMEGMYSQMDHTVRDAAEAAKSVVETTLQVTSLL